MSQAIHTVNPRLVTADRLAWGAALLTLIAGAAGFFINGLYLETNELIQTIRANDLSALVAALPVLVIGLWYSRRGSITGRLAAVGALLCLAYIYAVSAFSLHINAMTLIHAGIVGLAFWAVLLNFLGLDVTAAGSLNKRVWRRASAVFLFFMAGITILHWAAEVAGVLSSGNLSADLVKNGWVTNPLITLELALVVPLCLVTGYWLLRREASGLLWGVALLVLFALLDFGLLLTPFVIAAGGQPFDSGLFVFGAAFFAIPALLLVPVYRRRS